MTELELRKIEVVADDIDTMCDMIFEKAKAIAEQYTLQTIGRPDEKFTENTLDLIKIRLTMRVEKEIFENDN